MKLSEAYQKQQLFEIEALYQRSFPQNERKPFALILKKREEGTTEILSIEDENGMFLGLAITILYRDIALLDYFAVSEQVQGQGIGSTALRLLQKRYSGKRFMLEIEATEKESADRIQRIRRKSFYLRNGMQVMPYLVSLFGVEMEILTCGCTVAFSEYHEIFEVLYGSEAGRKVLLLDK